jgi:hypothetical protein
MKSSPEYSRRLSNSKSKSASSSTSRFRFKFTFEFPPNFERGRRKPAYAGFQSELEKKKAPKQSVQIMIRNSVRRPQSIQHVRSEENLNPSEANKPLKLSGVKRETMQSFKTTAINGVFSIMQDRKAVEHIELQKHCLIALPSKLNF